MLLTLPAIAFSPDYDPTVLRTEVAGKLVKKLKSDGARVKKGEPYCEVEVMKMFMPLKVEESGILSWCANEGAAISAGDLLATLVLENPDNVLSVSVYSGELEAPSVQNRVESRPHIMLRNSMETINKAMSGYVLSADAIETALANLALAVTRPSLPVFEIKEQLSILSGRIPADIFKKIDSLLNEYSMTSEIQAGTDVELR
jgi:acetyl-CoA carboxylase / biotin carboxylase 1